VKEHGIFQCERWRHVNRGFDSQSKGGGGAGFETVTFI
jgi:hypothetical protein